MFFYYNNQLMSLFVETFVVIRFNRLSIKLFTFNTHKYIAPGKFNRQIMVWCYRTNWTISLSMLSVIQHSE